jgi:outer membrane protein OmpA-like peptidoglycan-associated protein
MADLDVQPKKRGSILPWILAALAALLLLFLLARGCGDDKDDDVTTTTTTTGDTVVRDGTAAAAGTAAATGDWNDVDWNAPATNFEEVTNREINVRGNDRYAIYGLGENILFDEGKATIRQDAEYDLQQVAASIGKRFNGADVRIYGHTDASGSAGANQQLSAQRAEAVRNWLSGHGVDASKLSVHAQGEGQPAATNTTEAGRQENRRVEIVARKAS